MVINAVVYLTPSKIEGTGEIQTKYQCIPAVDLNLSNNGLRIHCKNELQGVEVFVYVNRPVMHSMLEQFEAVFGDRE